MKNKYCDDFRLRVSFLHHAMARDSTDVVESLLKHGHQNINSRDSAGQTPLYYAIFRGYRHGVNLLLNKGASVNIKDKEENTPLHFAVKKGNLNIVSDLVIAGADLEQRNNYGQTVLQYAIVWNYSKTLKPIVELLLRKGANVNSKDKDLETPLHTAAGRKDSKSVCLQLLERGANANAKDKRGNTPLHVASMKQCLEAIVTLINVEGVDIEERNKLDETSLHIAVKSRVPESLKLLLELGAEINAKDFKDKTALHVATKLGYADLMKVLIEQGASLEERDYKGNTALHCAAKSYGSDRTVGILLESGSAVHVFNNFDETPLHLAIFRTKSRYNTQAYKTILDWGTSINSKNYVNIPPLFSYDDAFDTFVEYLLKLKCAKIHLDTTSFDLPWSNILNKNIFIERELDKMKANRFGRHSLYDVFLNYSDPTFLTNNDLKEAIISPRFESQYPVYGYLIKVTLKKAEKRFVLLNKAQSNLNIPLPNEIQRKILAYLEENDLKNLIKAYERS